MGSDDAFAPPVAPDWRLAAGIPRRACIDLCTPAENAVRNAIAEVEKVGADPRLTQLVIDLDKIRERLADYIDRTVKSDPHSCMWCPVEVRDLAACAHNAVVNSGTGRGPRKMADLRDALARYQDAMNAHFEAIKR